MYGATFIKQLNSFILKGEMAYVTDKYFAVADVDKNSDGFLDSNGEFKRDHIRWGWAWTITGKAWISRLAWSSG